MKIAVIGSGKLGQRHLDSWSKIQGVEVVGVIARNKTRLDEVANKYGIKSYTSIQELLAATDVDVIDICTPTDTHSELVKEAANAKKHVICEKPLALTAEEAEEAILVCKENNVQLHIGHTLRFFPEYANARQQILDGSIGKPGVIRMKRGVPHPPNGDSWYADEARSGGLFLDLGIHDLDWLLWTFGDVQRVMAKRVKRSSEEKGNVEFGFITLKMTDGTICYVELSWAETNFHASFELAGDKGMITYNHNESNPLEVQIRPQVGNQSGVQVPRNVLEKDPYQRQLEHFVNCLLGKEEPIITAEEAAKSIKVAQAAIRSAKEGQPVTLTEGGR
ncbi:Gfo/Idh/MocA family protein [Lederbergia citrea]|uniref:Gfo/Idh/MocA family protein n=1 Tax=Lederbergia citrea TaxID=2833581 RepID=UPI001BC944B2|nr:Gfo/Idh/MocA family oxidoreductase [Lederbergia citrea]MBS4179353.1 Gfo/Idh/MocA family oxidoreductase [Lederbergia citrea]